MIESIETKRLILRAPKKSDVNDFFEYAKKNNIGPLAGWLPHRTVKDSLLILKDFIKKEDVWVITIKPSNKMVGSISLKANTFQDAIDGICEIGFAIDDIYWNLGYITEAVNSVIDVAFNRYDLNKIIAGHVLENKASNRVIMKTGFKFTHIDTSRVFSNEAIKEVYMYELVNPKK